MFGIKGEGKKRMRQKIRKRESTREIKNEMIQRIKEKSPEEENE